MIYTGHTKYRSIHAAWWLVCARSIPKVFIFHHHKQTNLFTNRNKHAAQSSELIIDSLSGCSWIVFNPVRSGSALPLESCDASSVSPSPKAENVLKHNNTTQEDIERLVDSSGEESKPRSPGFLESTHISFH